MKYLFALVATVAVAAEPPFIVGTIANRDNSNITFTTYTGKCTGNHKVVYAQSEGGKVGITGCWMIEQDQIFVTWKDGDLYTYPLEWLKLSPEMSKFLDKSTKYQ